MNVNRYRSTSMHNGFYVNSNALEDANHRKQHKQVVAAQQAA